MKRIRKAKTIYCPSCGRKMFKYDGRGEIPLEKYCQNCGRVTVYFPKSDITKTKRLPERTSSSSCRLWGIV